MPDDLIDRGAFAELQQTAGADFVVELVDTFIEEAPSMLAEMRAALAAPKAAQVRPASTKVDAAVTYLAGGPAAYLPIKVRHRIEPRILLRELAEATLVGDRGRIAEQSRNFLMSLDQLHELGT